MVSTFRQIVLFMQVIMIKRFILKVLIFRRVKNILITPINTRESPYIYIEGGVDYPWDVDKS